MSLNSPTTRMIWTFPCQNPQPNQTMNNIPNTRKSKKRNILKQHPKFFNKLWYIVILAKPDFLFCVISPRPSYQSLDLAVLFWRRSGLYRKLEEVPMGLDGDETSEVWGDKVRSFVGCCLFLLVRLFFLYIYIYTGLGRSFHLFVMQYVFNLRGASRLRS